jgi:WD40 repeat protein
MTLKGNDRSFACVRFTPSGKALALGLEFGEEQCRLWDVTTGKVITTVPEVRWFGGSMTLDSSGTRFASGGWGGAGFKTGWLQVFDLKTRKYILNEENHGVMCVGFSPDGKTLSSIIHDGEVKVWDLKTGKNIATSYWKTSWLRRVAWSRDGKMEKQSRSPLGSR